MKISIIIPVYNSAVTISRCLDSIIASGEREYEIILINDGSTDSTYSILEDYNKKYENLKVYHIENSGVSAARNLGIKYAQGEYISFVDSDDYVSENYVSTILEHIKSDKDIYFFSGKVLSENQSKNNQLVFISLCNTMSEVKHNLIKGKSNVPWDKLYKRDILIQNNINFREDTSLGEDWIFAMDYFEKCKNFELIQEILYFYCIQENSLSNKRMSEKMALDQIKLMDRILQFAGDNVETYTMILQLLTSCCSKLYRAGMSKTKIYTLFERKDWYDTIIRAEYLDLKSKIRVILMKKKKIKLISRIFGNK